MASAWSQQELDRLRERFEQLGQKADPSRGAEEPKSKVVATEAAAAYEALEKEVLARKDGAAAEPASPAAEPVPLDANVAAVERVLAKLLAGDPAGAGQILSRIVKLSAGVADSGLRAKIQDRILRYFDETARRLRDERPMELEAFVLGVYEALSGTDVLASHPLGKILAEVGKGRRVAKAAKAAPPAEDRAAELTRHLVGRLEGRLDGASKIIAARLVSFAIESKSSAFTARCEDRTLGANLTILDRFESALTLPAKYFNFDERFKIASSIFPDGVIGTDGEALTGDLGKFAWVLGADMELREGYQDALSVTDLLEFAEAVASAGEGMGVDGSALLGDLGGLGAAGLAGIDLGGLEGMARGVPLPALTAPSAGLGAGAPRMGAMPAMPAMPALPPAFAKLPPAALRAIQLGDAKALSLALGGKIALPKLEAILRLPVLASLRTVPAGGGLGSLSHLALGFQSIAGAKWRDAGLSSLSRLSFGGLGMDGGRGGVGYIGAPSMSYVGRYSLDLGRVFAGGALPQVAPVQFQALGTSLMPAARRSLGVRVAAPAPMAMPSLPSGAGALPAAAPAGAPALPRLSLASPRSPALAPAALRTVTTPAYQAHLAMPGLAAAMPSGMFRAGAVTMPGIHPARTAPRELGLPAFAIASDTFGVPRYRGASRLPAAALNLEGLDLGGTAVLGRSGRAGEAGPLAARVAPGAAPSSGTAAPQVGLGAPSLRAGRLALDRFRVPEAPRPFTYTSDDFGVTRIESSRKVVTRLGTPGAGADLRALDLGAPLGEPASFNLSDLDLTGGMLAPRRGRPGEQRGFAMPAAPALGSFGLDEHAAEGRGGTKPLALGLVELTFPAAAGAMGVPGAAMAVPAGGEIELPDVGAAPSAGAPAMAFGRAGAERLPAIEAPPATGASALEGAERPQGAASWRLRLRAAGPKQVLGSRPASLAFAPERIARRPVPIDKYYRPVESKGLALGSIAGFSLPAFGPARPAAVESEEVDYAPPSLARLTRPAVASARSEIGVSSYDAGGYAPAGRIGVAASASARYASLADERYGRVGREMEAIRENYSGEKMWRGGAVALELPALPQAEAAVVETPAAGEVAEPSVLPVAAEGAGQMPAVRPVPLRGSRAWRSGHRLAAPRLQGVYGAPGAPAMVMAKGGAAQGAELETAAGPADLLNLAQHGGIEAAHAPTAVNPRYVTLGLDEHLAPVIDRITSRTQPGERLDQGVARELEPVLGEIPEHIRIVRGPEADAATAALGTPAFTVGEAVVLSSRVRPDTREGMKVLAHEIRHAQAPRRPLHRFIDRIGEPGEAPAREAGERAARLAPTEGVVFGLVPRTIRGSFADRFTLDGWTEGDIRYRGGRLDAGVKLRESKRVLDLSVEHDFIRFPGDVEKLPAAAIPIDLTSQLSGRAAVEARTVADDRKLGLVFAPRPYEMPVRGLFWGRPGGEKAARGEVRFREVEFKSRFSAVDAERIEGELEIEGKDETSPARYRLERTTRGPAGAPGRFEAVTPRSVRQVPGAITYEGKGVKVGGRFGETETTVRAAGEFAADLTEVEAFGEKIAPAGVRPLEKRAGFLQATGLDVGRAEEVIERNRATAETARARTVRRGGLPSAAEWALTISVGGEEAVRTGEGAGTMALAFRRAGGAAEMAVEADSDLGRRIRATRGEPLSSPVLDFMERFFQRDLGDVRVSEGTGARALNRELGSEAFTTGQEIYVGPTKGEADRLAMIGHEVAHVVERTPAPSRKGAAPQARAAEPWSQGERRARESERRILEVARREPRERRAPKTPMTHTKVSPGADLQDEKFPIQKKKAADTPVQMHEKSGAVLPKPWEALFPRPPKRDLTPLVYQIWNRIKKELAIEMERRSGGF